MRVQTLRFSLVLLLSSIRITFGMSQSPPPAAGTDKYEKFRCGVYSVTFLFLQINILTFSLTYGKV